MKTILATLCATLLLAVVSQAQGGAQAEFKRRLAAIDMNDVSQVLDLAKWADENRLKASAGKLYEHVLTVDPDNETAHKALGHRLIEGRWLTKKEYRNWKRSKDKKEAGRKEEAAKEAAESEAAKLGEMKPVSIEKALAEHAKEDAKEAAEISDLLGGGVTAASSQHFALRSQFLDEDNRKLLIYCEQVYQALCSIYGQPVDEPLWPGRSWFYLFKDEASYYDTCAYIERKWSPYYSGAKNMTRHRQWECTGCCFEFSRDPKKQAGLICGYVDVHPEAYFANCVGKLFSAYIGGPHTVADRYLHWLDEGMAVYSSIRFHGSNALYRVTDSRYDGNSPLKDKNADTAYKLVCKEMAQGLLEHKSFKQLCRTDLNDLDYKDLAKSWSIVSFLTEKHLEKFRTFLRDFRKVERMEGETDQQCWDRHTERVLKRVFSWTPEELDRAWGQYVVASY